MDQKQMNTKAWDILREEKRGGQIVRTADILDTIPEVISAVKVDQEYLCSRIDEAFHSGHRPLNAILGLFGLCAVRQDEALRLIRADSGDGQGNLDDLLKLDERVLSAAVHRMARALAGVEAQTAQTEDEQVEKINALIGRLEAEERRTARLQSESQLRLNAAADRIQYMLSLLGPEDRESPISSQLYELLTDLSITAYWTAEGAPATDVAMFTTLRLDQVNGRKMKPCLIYNGEILAKGVRFMEE